ncbi:isochorismatase family protein [Alphaproteobacteria bacterium]|nr:isochorismatase family protein [Alphaproteobacteria bacterium]
MTNKNQIYKEQGLGNSLVFGNNPALLIIDFSNGFNDPKVFGGGNISEAILNSKKLLNFCRITNIPIAYSRIIYAEDGSNAGVFATKAPKLKTLTINNHLSHIVEELKPLSGEYIIDKTEASCFQSTGFLKWLVNKNIDTIIIAGCTTSGCVRATAVDACAYNYIPFVISDCVGDRAIEPHEASLFDLEQKYSEVISSEELIKILKKK